jgi:uncharacterized membrane protein (UPF0136 family)
LLTPQSLDIIAFVLGAITAGGGITGYARTGSIPSIVAGVTVGLLVSPPHQPNHPSRSNDRKQYGLGGFRIRNRQAYGVQLALLASIVLAGSSVPRAIRSGKPLPIGLSVLALVGLYNFGVATLAGSGSK